MFLEGTAFRNGFRNLDLDLATFPNEMPLYLGHPDSGEGTVGMAFVGRGSDQHLWIQFTISELDTRLCPDYPYFACSIKLVDEEGHFTIETVSLSKENIDPDIEPYVGY